jgi:hypothetical protein
LATIIPKKELKLPNTLYITRLYVGAKTYYSENTNLVAAMSIEHQQESSHEGIND